MANAPAAREQPLPAPFFAGIAEWSCQILADTPAGQERLARVFHHLRSEHTARNGTSLQVRLSGPGGPRLLFRSAAREMAFSELFSGPEAMRFEPLSNPSRRLYADPIMGYGPAFEMAGNEFVVLKENLWALYAMLGFVGLMLREAPLLCLHCAVSAIDSEAIILAGSSGAGKSTLSCALKQQGADYFGDEWAFFSLPDYRLHVWPREMCLRPGGVEALALSSEEMRWYEAKPNDPKCWMPFSDPARPCPQEKVSIYFMDGFGSQPEISPMGGGEAARRVFTGMSLGNPNIGERLAVAAGLINRYPFRRLKAGPPEATASLLLADLRSRRS